MDSPFHRWVRNEFYEFEILELQTHFRGGAGGLYCIIAVGHTRDVHGRLVSTHRNVSSPFSN